MADLRQDRRSDQGRLLAVGAAEFFAPGTVLVDLSVGDSHGFVAPPVTLVVSLGHSDGLFRPNDVTEAVGRGIADIMLEREIWKAPAERFVLCVVATLQGRGDLGVLFSRADDRPGSNPGKCHGDNEEKTVHGQCQLMIRVSKEKRRLIFGRKQPLFK